MRMKNVYFFSRVPSSDTARGNSALRKIKREKNAGNRTVPLLRQTLANGKYPPIGGFPLRNGRYNVKDPNVKSIAISLKRCSMGTPKWSGAVVAVLLCVLGTDGFQIPGIDRTRYKIGEHIDIKGVRTMNNYFSLERTLGFLPVCLQNNESVVYDNVQNFGQMLRGDRTFNTGYEVEVGRNTICNPLYCRNGPKDEVNLTTADAQMLRARSNGNFGSLQIDNLPGITRKVDKTGYASVEYGYPLGLHDTFRLYINNYFKFKLHYRKHGVDEISITEFEIEAHSIDSDQLRNNENICRWPDNAGPQIVDELGVTSVSFRYSVEWIESETAHEDRWDFYMSTKDIRSFKDTIFYMLVVGCIFSVIITTIVTRIRGREQSGNLNDSINETGWKSLHGDVFRIPMNPRFFAAVIGSGIQIFGTLVATLILGTFELLSPAKPGILVANVIFLYPLFGLIAGYFVARLYKTLGGDETTEKTLGGSLFVSIFRTAFETCFLFVVIFMVKQSSIAMSYTTMIAMLTFFVGLSSCLVYIGDYYGHRNEPFVHPCSVNEIPKQLVRQPWYMNSLLWALVAGIVIFEPVLCNLCLTFTSIWANKYSSLFGVFLIIFSLLATSCSQITILMIFGQLCKGDYRWWWRSFCVSGSSAIYLFAASIYYYATELKILEGVPILIYFGCATLIVVAYWLLTGTVGFFAAYVFIRQIYGTVKVNAVTDNKSDAIIISEKPPQIA